MPAKKLADALAGVDWNANAKTFLGDSASVDVIAKANLRLAMWAKQLEAVENKNPALWPCP